MSTESDAETDFVAQSFGDDVRLAPLDEGQSGLLRSTLDVAGGLLTFRIDHLEAPPTIVLTDVDSAWGWLDDVYGAGTADAVEDVLEHRQTRHVRFAPTALTATLARLSLGAWLQRWWPRAAEVSHLDLDLLGVELAALAWESDDVFAHRQPAAGLFEGDVAAALDRARTRGGESIVASALDAALELWPEDHPDLAAVEEFARTFDATASGGEPAHREDDPPSAPVIDIRTRARPSMRHWSGAIAADIDAPVSADGPARGSSSVDWRQVPPRILDWSEDTVELTLDERALHVSVAAADPPASAEIFARVYDTSQDAALPLALLRLELSDAAFVGSTLLPQDTALSDIAVDVYDPERVIRPQLDDGERRSARAERVEARSIIHVRSDEGGLDGVAGPFLAELS